VYMTQRRYTIGAGIKGYKLPKFTKLKGISLRPHKLSIFFFIHENVIIEFRHNLTYKS
jgi:hypothetical protein